jgi:hypothetical protein
MDAQACTEAEKLASSAPGAKYEPGVYGVFGVFVGYITVLTFGTLTDFSVERMERTMNIAVVVGFAVPYACFWLLSRRNLKALKAEY